MEDGNVCEIRSVNIDKKQCSFLEGILHEKGFSFTTGKTDWWWSTNTAIKYFFRCNIYDLIEIQEKIMKVE